jgi:hypothetical protein
MYDNIEKNVMSTSGNGITRLRDVVIVLIGNIHVVIVFIVILELLS